MAAFYSLVFSLDQKSNFAHLQQPGLRENARNGVALALNDAHMQICNSGYKSAHTPGTCNLSVPSLSQSDTCTPELNMVFASQSKSKLFSVEFDLLARMGLPMLGI